MATYFKVLIKGLLNDGHTVYLAAMNNDKQAFDEFEKLGARLINIPTSTNRPAALYQFTKTLSRFLQNTDIDIIHSHHRLTHFVAKILGRRFGLPRLLTFHFINHNHKLVSKLWANEFITVPSVAFKKHLIEFQGLKKANIQVIYNTIGKEFNVDDKCLRELKGCTFTEDKFYVTFVGRLSYEKGVDVLIESIPMVNAKEPGIAFRIFGSGDENEKLRKLCIKQKLDPKQLLRGTNFNINELLSLSDLAVIPSRNESFSLFALECMRAGAPVIATSVGGIPEVIENGETGLLIEPDNPVKLAESILRLYRDEKLRDQFAQKGRERFENVFSIDEFHQAHIKKYKEVIRA